MVWMVGTACVLRDIIIFLVAHTHEPNKLNKGLRVLSFLIYNFWSIMWSLGLSPWNKLFRCGVGRRGDWNWLQPLPSASTKTAIMAATLFFLSVFLSEKSWFSLSILFPDLRQQIVWKFDRSNVVKLRNLRNLQNIGLFFYLSKALALLINLQECGTVYSMRILC